MGGKLKKKEKEEEKGMRDKKEKEERGREGGKEKKRIRGSNSSSNKTGNIYKVNNFLWNKKCTLLTYFGQIKKKNCRLSLEYLYPKAVLVISLLFIFTP